MDKARAVEHFLYYLAHHPALIGLSRPTVLLGHTERYDAIAQAITHGSAARFNFQVQRLDLAPSHHLAQAIEACDLYLFLYDSSTLPNPRAEGPDFIRALHEVMAETGRNPCCSRITATISTTPSASNRSVSPTSMPR